MLNNLDDALAPHICLYVLILSCILQLFLLYISLNFIWVYFVFITFIVNALLCLKVNSTRFERNRVYRIVKNRIAKHGYDKTIFNGKCPNICMMTQATYIAIRFNSCRDFLYFYSEFSKKQTQYIHEDEIIELALNQIDISKISVGEIIHEYEK